MSDGAEREQSEQCRRDNHGLNPVGGRAGLARRAQPQPTDAKRRFRRGRSWTSPTCLSPPRRNECPKPCAGWSHWDSPARTPPSRTRPPCWRRRRLLAAGARAGRSQHPGRAARWHGVRRQHGRVWLLRGPAGAWYQIGPGTRTLVFGAGGASRAVVYALAAAGATVAVVNRTPDRAYELCQLIGVALPDAAARLSAHALHAAPPAPPRRWSGRRVDREHDLAGPSRRRSTALGCGRACQVPANGV